ncbi:unnamed protein product [Linum tenue]|uniref:RNA 3'-terminal phosphate cyclase domain-containing protein n=1 Tax=Linum tenue TaxID=586396 RepID=A0AAV0IN56_9ROSI|nr:unnamed protein product [Linum tenue]
MGRVIGPPAAGSLLANPYPLAAKRCIGFGSGPKTPNVPIFLQSSELRFSNHREAPRRAAEPRSGSCRSNFSIPIMGKVNYKKMKGSQNLRQRLLLSTLSGTPILVEDIRADDKFPGLRPHEISLLRLFDRVTDDCVVEINDTGTKFKYKPGVVMGGRRVAHDCGVSRAIGYFLEPLIVLGLFGKKPLEIRLKGITNDSKDPCVDTFRSTTLPILKRFGVPSEGLDLKIESRGVPPLGGGEVVLSVPIVQALSAVTWIDEGMVKRIRGWTFSAKVSSQFEIQMIHAARGIFNNLLPDVHIFTDHKAGLQAGNSPGYGISLVAETNAGCCISADTTISYARGDDVGDMEDEKKELKPPQDVGFVVSSLRSMPSRHFQGPGGEVDAIWSRNVEADQRLSGRRIQY